MDSGAESSLGSRRGGENHFDNVCRSGDRGKRWGDDAAGDIRGRHMEVNAAESVNTDEGRTNVPTHEGGGGQDTTEKGRGGGGGG